MKRFLLLPCLLLSIATPAWAKAAFFDEAGIVSHSDAVAIVELETPSENQKADLGASDEKDTSYYRLKSEAKVVTLLKGDLPKTFTLYAGESFICAQCTPTKGRFLAFLKKKGEFWTGTNYQLSLHPIKEGRTEWYKAADDYTQTPQDEAKVMERVRKLIADAVKK